MAYPELLAMLKRHEGCRLKPYRCTAGKLTIGYGRNLDDVGISDSEALLFLENDAARAVRDVQRALPWTASLDSVRQEVLVDMAFNLGLSRLLGFRKFLAALGARDYVQAAAEMLDSTWANQVGDRARELAAMILTGRYQEA